jgi:hypothetical protein
MSAEPVAVHGGWRRAGLSLALAWLLLLACGTHAARADTPRIVAMGDVHGDYDAFQALLVQSGIADDKGHWTGGKAIFVQLGDAVDRGARSRDIVLELQQLQKEASRAGGQVIALIGNHEAMNMEGDLRYVTPDDFHAYATRNSEALREKTFEANKDKLAAAWRKDNPQLSDAEIKARFEEKYPLGYFEQRIAWAPNGEIGRWVIGNPAVAIIGDSLFVHGGISAQYAALTVDAINDRVHAALNGTPGADKSILEDPVGPLWYRGLTEDNDNSRADIYAAFKAYGIKRMIIAHTPSLSGIKVLQDGRVTMIDTGIMHAYGGKRSFLTIEGGMIIAHDDGQATELKAVENPAAPQPPPPPVPAPAASPAPAAAAPAAATR